MRKNMQCPKTCWDRADPEHKRAGRKRLSASLQWQGTCRVPRDRTGASPPRSRYYKFQRTLRSCCPPASLEIVRRIREFPMQPEEATVAADPFERLRVARYRKTSHQNGPFY